MYSSTPSSKPSNSSLSSLFAVSIIIGTLEIFLISLHASHPSILGIITSKMIRSISLLSTNTSTASSPLDASTTSYCFLTRKSLTSFLILSSSSTTRIFNCFIIFLHSTLDNWQNLIP